MDKATLASLAADIIAAGVQFTVTLNPDQVGDWIVQCSPNGSVDAKAIVALETKHGVSCPINTAISFV